MRSRPPTTPQITHPAPGRHRQSPVDKEMEGMLPTKKDLMLPRRSLPAGHEVEDGPSIQCNLDYATSSVSTEKAQVSLSVQNHNRSYNKIA